MFQYAPYGIWNPADEEYVRNVNDFLFSGESGLFTKRIEEDRKHFRDIISGRLRKELRRLISSGGLVKRRGKNGKVVVTIPRINIPHIVFGDNGEGVGRGKGDKGDVIGRDKGKSDGEGGSEAGDQPGEGIRIAIDLEDVLKFLQQELELPDLKPKENETFEEVKIKYNDISLSGPESLRHSRRTYKQALKRSAGAGTLGKLQNVPGMSVPMPIVEVQQCDKRYRQYNEIKIPSSNAVIFFARDWSGSMDAWRCDCVSDTCWWIDCWIRRFYKRTERCWVGHDTDAQEVDMETFYNYRYGGGTICSSAMKYIAKQLENRFPPKTWNIYIFYFTDGENWSNDNENFFKVIHDEFDPNTVNMVGITQIMAWNYNRSVKGYVDSHLTSNMTNVRTVSIGPEENPDGWGGWGGQLDEEARNLEIMNAIKALLGKDSKARAEMEKPNPMIGTGV